MTDAAGTISPGIYGGATAAGSNIKITVRDGAATYPLNIDPTWSNPSTDVYVVSGEGVQPVNLTTGAGTDETLSGGQMFIPPGLDDGMGGLLRQHRDIVHREADQPAHGNVQVPLSTWAASTGLLGPCRPTAENIYATSNDDTSVAVFNTVTRVASTFIIGSAHAILSALAPLSHPTARPCGWPATVLSRRSTWPPIRSAQRSRFRQRRLREQPCHVARRGTLYATFGGNCDGVSPGIIPIDVASGAVGSEISVQVQTCEARDNQPGRSCSQPRRRDRLCRGRLLDADPGRFGDGTPSAPDLVLRRVWREVTSSPWPYRPTGRPPTCSGRPTSRASTLPPTP